uniref:G-protein coupled receptors family 1 profile domain-containing protein n=1 Tax=Oryzias sinensis TaxID=183150 RepID=A0A8C8DDN3_9TELE
KRFTHSSSQRLLFFNILPPSLPEEDHTLRILLYSLIFFLSVFGNLLIIVVLTVNKRMRTVTNTFLLSLAMMMISLSSLFCPILHP